MKYLYSRLTKTNLATMDNDAKSCYDRIICNIAMIISQYYGVNCSMASLHATTLKKMKYRLRTALGDSLWAIRQQLFNIWPQLLFTAQVKVVVPHPQFGC
jgi:hypothetical protein